MSYIINLFLVYEVQLLHGLKYEERSTITCSARRTPAIVCVKFKSSHYRGLSGQLLSRAFYLCTGTDFPKQKKSINVARIPLWDCITAWIELPMILIWIDF